MDEDGYALLTLIQKPKVVVDYSLRKDRAKVRYVKSFFNPIRSNYIFNELLTYRFAGVKDGGIMYGVKWESERKTIQIAEPGVGVYKYTGSAAKETISFDQFPIIKEIKDILYEHTGYEFNFCLYNCYTLNSKLGWHSDKEDNMIKDSPIASLSFGFKRRFRIRSIYDGKDLFDEYLEPGSLLLMEDQTQALTEHCVWNIGKKKMKEYEELPEEETIRINLTYRVMKVQ